MRVLIPSADTIRLLRIPFSLFLLPVFLLALSQAENIDLLSALASFFIIHFLVYPASNGYNSYVDRDTSSIGGLENPPMPTRELFYTTLLLDLLAIFMSWFILPLFALLLALYIIASRAYSSRQVRLKKYPLASFLTVVFFQGPVAFYTSYLGITGKTFEINGTNIFILLASTFQIAGAYPLTQIYQHKEDQEEGVISISYKLGYTGTFIFTGIMFAFSDLCFLNYFRQRSEWNYFILLQVFFVPVMIYFTSWFRKVLRDNSEASYRNTMKMNLIASLCMSTCFLMISVLKFVL
jgi:4-hydroxybenzoate polyprenyltransferase